MKFSDGEKLILAMLSEIHKGQKTKGEIDPEFVMRMIYSGQTWALKWKYSGLFSSSEDTSDVVQETCDILGMYRRLSWSYDKLSKTDKERVQKEGEPFSDYLEYQGFDGNNDPHIGVVPVLVKDLGRYEEVKNPDLNSHSSATINIYRNMLRRLKPLQDSRPDKPLTADQIIQVLKG